MLIVCVFCFCTEGLSAILFLSFVFVRSSIICKVVFTKEEKSLKKSHHYSKTTICLQDILNNV